MSHVNILYTATKEELKEMFIKIIKEEESINALRSCYIFSSTVMNKGREKAAQRED